MKLEDLTKDELLEAIDVLYNFDGDPESIYDDRDSIVEGPKGDALWEKCQKYRQPLIDFCFRNITL